MKTERNWLVAKDAEKQWESFEKKKKRTLSESDSMRCGVRIAVVQVRGNAPWRTVHGVRYCHADIGKVGSKFAEIWVRENPREVMRVGVKTGLVYVMEE